MPADLQPFIAADRPRWTHDAFEFVAEPGEDASEHPATAAATWHGAHQLDFGYLRNPPRLRFWRTVRGARDEITVDWRHEDDGEIGFTAGPEVRHSTVDRRVGMDTKLGLHFGA